MRPQSDRSLDIGINSQVSMALSVSIELVAVSSIDQFRVGDTNESAGPAVLMRSDSVDDW